MTTTLSSIRNAAIEDAGAGGLTVYATKEDLPTTNLTEGDQAYVSSNRRLYVSNGSGWYNVALVNATPTLTISPSGAIELSTAGTNTVITLTGTDSDNAVDGLTFSVESDGSFAGLGTLSQDSSVFTITPLSEDSATTTTSTLTFKASDGINFGSGTSVLTLLFTVANSNYTTLLLQADNNGTDDQVDASTSNNTVTEVGTMSSTAFTPYHPGGYSAEFVSGINYLHVDNDVSSVQWMYNGSTAEGTFEAWIYQTAQGTGNLGYTFPCILGNGPTYFNFGVNNAQLTFYYWTGSQVVVNTGATISLNTWHHVAYSNDSSNTFRIFLDGVLVHTISSWPGVTWAATANSDEIYIGTEGQNAATSSFTGFIRDARMIQGTALYTSTFTPPIAPLTTITNTEWLFCHAPYIKDGSTNNVVISDNYGVSTARVGPYDHESYTKVNHGGSVYFGNNVANSYRVDGVSAFGTVDFTVEFWVYLNTSHSATLWDSRPTNGNGAYFLLAHSATDGIGLYVNTAYRIQAGSPLEIKTWNHIAASRVSGTTTLYVNGTSVGTWADTTNYITGASRPVIGRNGYTASNQLNGYMSDVRVVEGTGVYTANFTSPIEPLTAVTNTDLLTFTNKNDIWDVSSHSQVMTKSGNVTASNTQRKFTTSSSIYFDGTGDYLDFVKKDEYHFSGSDDFTVEGWWYFAANSGTIPLILMGTGVDATPAHYSDWIMYRNGSGNFAFGQYSNTSNVFRNFASFTPTLNTWYHIAVSRSGTDLKGFIDGQQQGSTITDSTAWTNKSGSRPLRMGRFIGGGGSSSYFNGYAQSVRVTKGLARYTTNFTPPTEEFKG